MKAGTVRLVGVFATVAVSVAGCSPLGRAIRRNDVPAVMDQIRDGTDVKARIRSFLPLAIAAEHGSVDAAKALLAAGALPGDCHCEDLNEEECRQPIAVAIGPADSVDLAERRYQIARMLLDGGASPNGCCSDPSVRDCGTPLLAALQANHAQPERWAKLLIDKGAALDRIYADGRSILDVALARQAYGVVKLLLERGLRLPATRGKAILMCAPLAQCYDTYGPASKTPQHGTDYCTEDDVFEMAQIGANPSLKDFEDGPPPRRECLVSPGHHSMNVLINYYLGTFDKYTHVAARPQMLGEFDAVEGDVFVVKLKTWANQGHLEWQFMKLWSGASSTEAVRPLKSRQPPAKAAKNDLSTVDWNHLGEASKPCKVARLANRANRLSMELVNCRIDGPISLSEFGEVERVNVHEVLVEPGEERKRAVYRFSFSLPESRLTQEMLKTLHRTNQVPSPDVTVACVAEPGLFEPTCELDERLEAVVE